MHPIQFEFYADFLFQVKDEFVDLKVSPRLQKVLLFAIELLEAYVLILDFHFIASIAKALLTIDFVEIASFSEASKHVTFCPWTLVPVDLSIAERT